MGIRNMDWNSWIELDDEWMKFHQRKLDRVQERGTEVYGTPPEAWDPAIEYLMELRSFLPQRYPTLFEQTEKGIRNLVTGEDFRFVDIPKEDFKQDPMLMAALMVQDDLAILIENENGEYVLKAGAIMLAGFWRLKDKFNLPLSKIHTSGNVPKYKEKLQKGMEKFFVRLTCDKPVVRNNYFIQTDDDLAWSPSIGKEANEKVGWYTAEPATDVSKLYYRSERQSVRRLPKTGAIAFTIRTYFLPVTKMCQEPYVPRRLLNGIVSWEDSVKEYRGFDKFKDVLIPYLNDKALEQEEQGYTIDNEKEKYPF
ncbi:DEKNAAC103409 [Brettanomyces naardenensis]|uniref:DEKNAAC103409 n=1 Tax=Brettanomyces naardenensis TaxID=13370 RepID=A0A448YNQ5_BRENA|nr:DEKNAAC103409 [Brettanomyces naardenensis]